MTKPTKFSRTFDPKCRALNFLARRSPCPERDQISYSSQVDWYQLDFEKTNKMLTYRTRTYAQAMQLTNVYWGHQRRKHCRKNKENQSGAQMSNTKDEQGSWVRTRMESISDSQPMPQKSFDVQYDTPTGYNQGSQSQEKRPYMPRESQNYEDRIYPLGFRVRGGDNLWWIRPSRQQSHLTFTGQYQRIRFKGNWAQRKF